MRRRRPLPLLLTAVALALAAVIAIALHESAGPRGPVTAAGASPPSAFTGAVLPSAVVAPPFTLRDQRGAPVSLQSFRGQVVVLAFPYVACGATCVVIAQQIRGALDHLRTGVPVLFISADPRDTRAGVARFLASESLAGRVQYLTGTPRQLRALWRAYRVTPAAAGPAAFDRAATVTLVDASGHERVVYGLEQLTPEALAHDIGALETG